MKLIHRLNLLFALLHSESRMSYSYLMLADFFFYLNTMLIRGEISNDRVTN